MLAEGSGRGVVETRPSRLTLPNVHWALLGRESKRSKQAPGWQGGIRPLEVPFHPLPTSPQGSPKQQHKKTHKKQKSPCRPSHSAPQLKAR